MVLRKNDSLRGEAGCGKTQKFSVIGGKHRSGPEGPVDFIGVMRGLKPPPPSGSSFSAACKAHEIAGV
jgi:hypothetical protein